MSIAWEDVKPAPASSAPEELPLEPMVLPEPKGFFDRRFVAGRKKLLAAFTPVLRTALEPGERVHAVGQGFRYQRMEYLLTGHATAQFANQTALVLTDRRLLMLSVGVSGRPRDIKNQVRLSEIRGVKKPSRFGSGVLFELADGSKLDFRGLHKRDSAALLERVRGNEDATRGARSLEHLCPCCMKVVPGPVGTSTRCPACRIPFRDPQRAAKLSALVPGVGDLYLRHYLFGTLEFMGSMATLCIAVVLMFVAAAAPDAGSVAAASVAGVGCVLLPRLIDYFLTLHMGKKGLVPLSLKPAAERDDDLPLRWRSDTSLPAFPRWAQGLFVAGALAVPAACVVGLAQGDEERTLAEARATAAAGHTARALELWEKAKTEGLVDDDDRAKMTLAFYEAGDLESGDRLVDEFGNREIDKGLATRINAFVERGTGAFTDYDQGYQALLAGDEEAAWPALDRASQFFQSLPHAKYPKTREAVLVEAAGELLAPPPSEEDVSAASAFLERAGDAVNDERGRVARARLLTLQGKQAELAGLELGALPLGWRLLALETLAVQGEPAAIAAEAEKVAGKLTPYSEARRLALMAQGGKFEPASAEVTELAVTLAGSQGWDKAAEALQARLPEPGDVAAEASDGD